MFKCGFCRLTIGPNVSCLKVTTVQFMCDHPQRAKANKRIFVRNGKTKKEWSDDPGGRGLQIAQEVDACPTCFFAHSPTKTQPPKVIVYQKVEKAPVAAPPPRYQNNRGYRPPQHNLSTAPRPPVSTRERRN